jgi:NADPH-dependent ferric siderophore reductase
MTTPRDPGFRLLSVLSSARIAPRMQRLRLAGTDIARFATPDNLHVRLHIADIDAQGTLNAMHGLPGLSRKELSPLGFSERYYTIRRIDVAAGWMDVDFILHEKPGPGSDFALKAKPGDVCGVSGPCGRGVKTARRYLLAGDETALPAIARIAEELPPDIEGRVLIEVDAIDDGIDLDVPAGISVTWLHRHGSKAEHSRLLRENTAAAVSEMSASRKDDLFVWIAGEYGVLSELRPALVPVGKARCLCVAYWRAEDAVRTIVR